MTSATGSAPKAVLLLRIEADPVLRLATVFGAIEIPGNALDAGAQTYRGLGALASGIPVVQQLLNGVADRASFTLSGVPASVAALLEDEAAAVRGAPVNLGLVKLDDDWQPIGAVLWLWDGTADKISASSSMQEGDQVYAVTMSVGTAHATRRRPAFASWTDVQHQRAHPGDLFFNQVPAAEKQKRWPI
jgi:hypothetical protein